MMAAVRRPRRKRYMKKLAEQSENGDLGAEVEWYITAMRDLAVLGRPVPVGWCDCTLAAIRKLRRTTRATNEAWLRQQLEGLGKAE
jgi:hypothetical protein